MESLDNPVFHSEPAAWWAGAEPLAVARITRDDTGNLQERLRFFVARGPVAPGDHLPIDALADEFRTSATPVREALAGLASIGIVTSTPHRGYFVPTLSLRTAADLSRYAANILFSSIPGAAVRQHGDVLSRDLKGTVEHATRVSFLEHQYLVAASLADNQYVHESIRLYCDLTHKLRCQNLSLEGAFDAALGQYAQIVNAAISPAHAVDPSTLRSAFFRHLSATLGLPRLALEISEAGSTNEAGDCKGERNALTGV